MKTREDTERRYKTATERTIGHTEASVETKTEDMTSNKEQLRIVDHRFESYLSRGTYVRKFRGPCRVYTQSECGVEDKTPKWGLLNGCHAPLAIPAAQNS